MKKKVLILSTIQGHASLAEAMREELETLGFEPIVHSYVDPILPAYRVFYQHAPQLIKIAYLGVNRTSLELFVRQYLQSNYDKRLQDQVDLHQPACIICTNWGFNPSLDKFSEKNSIPSVNILNDPRTFFNFNVMTQGAVNCVFDKTVAHAVKGQFPTAQVEITGWPVQKVFEDSYRMETIRKELGFKSDLPLFLFVTGSEGTKMVLPIVRELVDRQLPIQIAIICGRNKQLAEELKMMRSALSKQSPTTLTVLGFTTEIYKYMQASDLVIGKAGPNTLFESVATLTPFMATTHISGQEDGNLDIITDYEVGYVAEDTTLAVETLIELGKNPKQLEKFKPALKKLATHNARSKTAILKFVIDKI
ncbi:MAG: glycosyltransferase [Microgenomates group bacterium]